MDKITLFESLKSESMLLSSKEIQSIMDEELAKKPNEMDTELVDLCVEALSNNAKHDDCISNNKRKKVKLSKILLVAAIIIVIFSIAVPVTAKFVHQNASKDIVNYSKDHFDLHLKDYNKSASDFNYEPNTLTDILNKNGFDNVILPKAILNQSYTADEVNIDDDEFIPSADFNFEVDGVKGDVRIYKFVDDIFEDVIDQIQTGLQFDTVEQVDVNGIDVLVFADKKDIMIIYVNSKCEYVIYLNKCDIDTGKRIAETIY